jgi:L-asparaginase II
VSAATGVDVERVPRGRDGCSIPTHALPLDRLALAFARFGSGQGLSPAHAAAAARLRRAVAAAPFMVGGSGRFDTEVMQALGARVFCKVGAEAVYTAALPELGWGVALKIDDGNTARAAEVVMAALLQAALALPAEAAPADPAAAVLARWAEQPQANWRGLRVGRLGVAEALRHALGRLPRA